MLCQCKTGASLACSQNNSKGKGDQRGKVILLLLQLASLPSEEGNATLVSQGSKSCLCARVSWHPGISHFPQVCGPEELLIWACLLYKGKGPLPFCAKDRGGVGGLLG